MPLSLFNIFKQHIEFHAFQEFSERGHVTPLTKVFFMNKTKKLRLQMSGTKHSAHLQHSLCECLQIFSHSAPHTGPAYELQEPDRSRILRILFALDLC